MSKITTMVAACTFLAASFVLAPGPAAAARAASRLAGADLPAPKYPGGLTAGYCVGIGTNSWGPFRSRADAETYAEHLPSARAAGLMWCPIRL